MGPPHGALFPEKNFRSFAAKIFFRFTVEFGGPWGPLLLPRRGPWGPLRLVSLPENFFRSSAAKKIFRFTVEFWRFVFFTLF